MSSYKTNCAWGSRGFCAHADKPKASPQTGPKTQSAKPSAKKPSVFDRALTGIQQFTDDVDEPLLRALAKNYAITQANPDAASVACSDDSELNTVIDNFAVKKLGMTKDNALEAVQGVCEDMAASRQKNRILFYYLLTKKVGKESVFV